MSYALDNLKKEQAREGRELLLTIGYRLAEVSTAVAIFAFAYLFFSIV